MPLYDIHPSWKISRISEISDITLCKGSPMPIHIVGDDECLGRKRDKRQIWLTWSLSYHSHSKKLG